MSTCETKVRVWLGHLTIDMYRGFEGNAQNIPDPPPPHLKKLD